MALSEDSIRFDPPIPPEMAARLRPFIAENHPDADRVRVTFDSKFNEYTFHVGRDHGTGGKVTIPAGGLEERLKEFGKKATPEKITGTTPSGDPPFPTKQWTPGSESLVPPQTNPAVDIMMGDFPPKRVPNALPKPPEREGR